MTLTRTPAAATSREISRRTQLATLSGAMLKGFFRDRTALFFTFVFPLMFLIVFGLIFKDAGSSRTPIAVTGSGPIISALPTQLLDLQPVDSEAAGIAKVSSGDLPAAISERGQSVTVRYAASNPAKAALIQGIIGAVVDQANLAASGRPATYRLQAARVEDASLAPIQFVTPGILSWGIATSATFGAALSLVSWRKTQLLRRMRLSPAPVWTVVGARVWVSLVVSFAQAALFVGLALTPLFGLRLTGQWWWSIPLLAVGTLAFLSIGLLVGAVAKTEEAASALANFLVLPMAFLSGTFFDITQAPGWLQAISKVLPLRWMNDAMLDVLVRDKGLAALLPAVGVLAGFAAVLTLVATRVFRWDDV
jgi:ABC-2 type transport system permease protein